MSVSLRAMTDDDIPNIIALCLKVYPGSLAWSEAQLRSHLDVFPEGQFVAIDDESGALVGMAASLIILWSDYELHGNWRDFTASGFFTNHDTSGRTLYGAEIMVDPATQGQGVGSLLYTRREQLVRDKGLLRIRAGARLRGYSTYAKKMDAHDYVIEVIRGNIVDPTLTFQLNRGFTVFALVPDYLSHDPESLGFAAVIEWINKDVAKPEDYASGNPSFQIIGPWSKSSDRSK